MKQLYCIFDCVSKQFAEPFCLFNDSDAARMFSSWCMQNAKKYDGFKSTDYSLFAVGSFDPASGEIVPCYREIAVNTGDE